MAFRFCFAILALASSILAMTVESRDEQPSNEAQTALRIRLFNDSGIHSEMWNCAIFSQKRNYRFKWKGIILPICLPKS